MINTSDPMGLRPSVGSALGMAHVLGNFALDIFHCHGSISLYECICMKRGISHVKQHVLWTVGRNHGLRVPGHGGNRC